MVKEGYKETEIGVIPTDWEISKLGSIGQFKNGINKDKEKFGYGVPIIGLMDVFGVNYIDSISNSGLVDASVYEQEDYSVREGDVLFVRSSVKPSGVGLTAVVKNTLDNAVFSGFLLRYRTNKLTTGFKRYVFYASYFRENVVTASTVSANTNINQDNLKQLFVAYPTSEKEQNQIAEALSDMDNLIFSLKELIEKKKAIKQGAMQELLTGKKRLPGFSGEWQRRKLAKVANRYDNLRVPVAAYLRVAGSTPYYGANGIQDYVEGFTHDGEFVLVAEDGANDLKNYPVKCVNGRIWVNNHAHVLQGKYGITDNRFLAYSISQTDIESLLVGGGRAKLNAEVLMNIELAMPTKNEQTAIASILSDMDNEIGALEQKIEKCQKLKRGMMQQLLTGKTRLI